MIAHILTWLRAMKMLENYQKITFSLCMPEAHEETKKIVIFYCYPLITLLIAILNKIPHLSEASHS